MKHSIKRRGDAQVEPVRVLGRGLRAQRGVHLTLRTVREAAGKTQIDVAALSEIDQSDVSRLESREDFDDCQVSTLRRYVEAIGGQLELVAAFGNKKIILAGASTASRQDRPAAKANKNRPGRGELRAGYDLSEGVRGKYVTSLAEGSNASAKDRPPTARASRRRPPARVP